MNKLDGYALLDDAYATLCTDNPNAREIDGYGDWIPSDAVSDYDLENAASQAACDAGDTSRGLLEICLEYLGDDPIWQELEEAAGRALRRYCEEMDREAENALEEEDSEEDSEE